MRLFYKQILNSRYISYYFLIFLIFILFLAVCRKSVGIGAVAVPGDLLPKKDDISGFKEKGSTVTMNDKKSIAEAIDGAVEKYTGNGFIEGVQQFYSNGAFDVDIHIFNYVNNDNARAVYDDFYPSTPDVLSQGIVNAVIEQGLNEAYVLYYVKENIYMELIAYEKSDFSLSILKQFYLNIDGKINLSY